MAAGWRNQGRVDAGHEETRPPAMSMINKKAGGLSGDLARSMYRSPHLKVLTVEEVSQRYVR